MKPNPNQRPAGKTTDEHFDLLGSWQRRFLLQHLQRHPTPVSVEHLATELVDSSNRGELRVDEAKLQLRHVHLPKLATAGLVEYDPSAGTVEPTASTTGPGGPIERVGAAVNELTERLTQ